MIAMQRRLLPATGALAAFDAVARLGSFSAAAQELSLTQSAISKQIAALEGQLGIALFERTGRGVALTQQGTAYAVAVADALATIRAASLRAMAGEARQTLNLAILPTFGTRWLMPRIPSFIARHPEVTLNFATRIGRFDIEAEGFDATTHIGTADWPGTESTFLMHETVAPMASPAFLREHPITAPDDLARLPLLHMGSRPEAWDHWFRTAGVSAPAAMRGMRFEQFSTVAQACMAGVGVALLPLFLIASEIGSGQLVVAFDHPVRSPRSYYLISPRARARLAPVAAFRRWLIAEVDTWKSEGGYDEGGPET
ncbi:DNA-binding transcriptional LysR family regulator [Pseudochelatococcus lubricantis]|uniref:DNA-binding transcriptional LysR family regulator n=1 Tax=Pseudochelatococcus lubricantis TaxID=1538102 RepID=A0ABX0UYP2_9HYPH|nr:LysR family transcriptional regulator [Pseudochelatococcus lubricantis]NIJ58069.1 DNA-binding transcriptional LysR family regulator [Pseudochelatococcus lubricantis]